MKKFTKIFLASILITSTGIGSLHSNTSKAEENTAPQNVKLVGTYDVSQVDSKTMKQFKDIEKEDSNFHVIKKDNKVTIEDTLPNPDKKNNTANRSNE
ncbi:hypothetical protein ABXK36_37855, partial [Bacillus cereus]